MKRFLVGCLAVIGALSLIGVVGIVVLTASAFRHLHADRKSAAAVPDHVLLSLSLSRGVIEAAAADPVADLFGKNGIPLRDVIDAIDQGAHDAKVQGLIVDFGGSSLGLTKAEEIRAAVHRFRAAGKPAYAFADTYAESATPNQLYYLASAFDQIWVQPAGEISVPGISIEKPYIADGLKMIGVEPRLSQRYEYKGGIDTFTGMNLPLPVKENLGRLVNDLFGQITSGIAADRNIAEPQLRKLLEQGAFSANDALAAHLIDKIGYRSEADQAVRVAAKTTEQLSCNEYLARVGRSITTSKKDTNSAIAIIYGVGTVVRGSDTSDEDLASSSSLAAQEVSRAFAAAAGNPNIRAIIFRIDSPGGSYTASDTIWRAVHDARSQGKKVIVSMGSLAASGGYFAAIGADRIVADRASITGSIGVYSGKFVLNKLWDKLGIRFAAIEAGPHPGVQSPNRDFTPEEQAQFEHELDRVYADFAGRVAKDRNLTPEQTDQIARGRVWSGEAAQKVGLVDKLGGLDQAVLEAKSMIGIAADQKVKLIPYPKVQSTLDRVMALFGRVPARLATLANWSETAARLDHAAAPFKAELDADQLSAPVNAATAP